MSDDLQPTGHYNEWSTPTGGDLPDATRPKRVRVSYRGTGDPHQVREAVFGAAYEAMTGRPAEEFTGPRGWYVAEMVVRDPDGNPEVWARWTTEDPGRTGPAQLLNPNFREKLRRAGWHVSYLSPGAPLEPLAGRLSAPDGGDVR